MTVALSLLAFLQYRWITEVSDAEEQRLQDNLNSSTTRFADEFQEQLRQLAAAFRPTGSNADADAAVDIVGQYQRSVDAWTAAASYPELLQDGFLLRAGESQGPQILQINTKEKRFDPVDWPDDFASLRSAAAHAVPGRPMPRFSAENIPAIVIPLAPPRPESGPGRPPPRNDGGRRGRGGRGQRPPGSRGFNRDGGEGGERGERRGPPPQQPPPPPPPPSPTLAPIPFTRLQPPFHLTHSHHHPPPHRHRPRRVHPLLRLVLVRRHHHLIRYLC